MVSSAPETTPGEGEDSLLAQLRGLASWRPPTPPSRSSCLPSPGTLFLPWSSLDLYARGLRRVLRAHPGLWPPLLPLPVWPHPKPHPHKGPHSPAWALPPGLLPVAVPLGTPNSAVHRALPIPCHDSPQLSDPRILPPRSFCSPFLLTRAPAMPSRLPPRPLQQATSEPLTWDTTQTQGAGPSSPASPAPAVPPLCVPLPSRSAHLAPG